MDLFRLNLSHTPLAQVEPTIDFVRQQTRVPLCLDTEGAQVRCGVVADGVVLRAGQRILLTDSDVSSTGAVLTLRPASVVDALEPGALVSIDFDGALLEVTRLTNAGAEAVVIDDGMVRSNKAVTIEPAPPLAALTPKDIAAVAAGAERGVRHFALSFASCAGDVERLRALTPPGSSVIAKVESRAGVANLAGIAQVSDAILIDRGDLSREVPVEQVPLYQKEIIRRARTWNTPVYVATNLLESMVQNRRPTIAEANDIMNTLIDGADGLVLAAETAVGAYPVRAVEMVRSLARAFEGSTSFSIAA